MRDFAEDVAAALLRARDRVLDVLRRVPLQPPDRTEAGVLILWPWLVGGVRALKMRNIGSDHRLNPHGMTIVGQQAVELQDDVAGRRQVTGENRARADEPGRVLDRGHVPGDLRSGRHHHAIVRVQRFDERASDVLSDVLDGDSLIDHDL